MIEHWVERPLIFTPFLKRDEIRCRRLAGATYPLISRGAGSAAAAVRGIPPLALGTWR